MDGKAKYRKFLKSEFWKELSARKKSMVRKCQECGRKDRLQAHHVIYRDNWYETRLEDLRVLCRKCHMVEHGMIFVDDGIFPYREDRRFNLIMHRCQRLRDMIFSDRPLRPRDFAFLEKAERLYPTTPGDGCVEFHVNHTREMNKKVGQYQQRQDSCK